MNIAVDGPSGAGKSTLCRALAKELGFIYVDTGAMYRAIALYALEKGADLNSEEAMAALLPDIDLDLVYRDGEQRVYLCGRDVSDEIRTPEVSMATSAVSRFPAVRAFLLESQRGLARRGDVLMDGRDIGTVVLPDAQLKIFLTASPEDRARRRYEELILRGEEVSREQVLADVIRRDQQDSSRLTAPLRPAEDAVVVDTSGNTFEESFRLLLDLVKERL